MSTKNRLKEKEINILQKEDSKEKKIKDFIEDMIKYYKDLKKN